MEMADGMLINKADGDNLTSAKLAKREYQNALHLFPAAESGSSPKVEIFSALNAFNLKKAWKMIDDFIQLTTGNNYFELQRKSQLNAWFKKSIQERLNLALFGNERINSFIVNLETKVIQKQVSPTEAADLVFEEFKKSFK